MNMSKEEFLLALHKEGLLIYGTTWLENFRRLQELKKYKEMWEELEGMFKPGKVFYICKNKNFQEHAQKIMDLKYIIDELKQKYFPEPKEDTIEVIIETKSKIDFTELWNDLSDGQREILRKCLSKKV